MFKKYFTLKEANQRLHDVKPIVTDILSKSKEIRALIEMDTQSSAEQASMLSEEIAYLIAKLETMGCFYKDWNFEIGLVDFPARIDDEDALLCWRSDEGEILWYHSLEDGFSGRKPLPAEWLLGDLFKEK